MNLTLFDLDNTLIATDSDYEWGQFLIARGLVDGAAYEARNNAFFDAYKAGTLDIHDYLLFALEPLARHPRAELDAWHKDFMDAVIRPAIPAAAVSVSSAYRRIERDAMYVRWSSHTESGTNTTSVTMSPIHQIVYTACGMTVVSLMAPPASTPRQSRRRGCRPPR